MSGFPTKHERIKIVPARESELGEEPLVRIEFYRRYWAVGAWDSMTRKVLWAETIRSIGQSLNTNLSTMTTMVKKYPVLVEPLACPGCVGPVYVNTRQTAQQALRGSVPLCGSCMAMRIEEMHRSRLEKEQKFVVHERKIQKAFNATICDDRHPEECVSFLSESAVALYQDMLAQYREPQRHVADDHMGRPIFVEPEVLLCGPWAHDSRNKYETSGPDLYALARHRLIKPKSDLAGVIGLTLHGLINPSGYCYIAWTVEEEVDGLPVVEIINNSNGS